MPQESAALEHLGLALGKLVVGLGSAVGFVVTGWVLVKVILSGGSDRAAGRAIVSLLAVGIVLAALSRLQDVVTILTLIGGGILSAVLDMAKTAF